MKRTLTRKTLTSFPSSSWPALGQPMRTGIPDDCYQGRNSRSTKSRPALRRISGSTMGCWFQCTGRVRDLDHSMIDELVWVPLETWSRSQFLLLFFCFLNPNTQSAPFSVVFLLLLLLLLLYRQQPFLPLVARHPATSMHLPEAPRSLALSTAVLLSSPSSFGLLPSKIHSNSPYLYT